MNTIKCVMLTLAAALAFAACASPTSNAPANAPANANATATNANKAAAAPAPNKDALVTLEKSAWEAWKSKNKGFWDGFLASNFVGFSATNQRLDKAAAMKDYSGENCDVKGFTFSDESMTTLGADVAVLTYKVAVDGTCDGQKLPPSWETGVYVRDGDKWKGAFHAGTPVTDPNASPAKPAAKPAETKPAAPAEAPAADENTKMIMAVETKAWDSWKARDVKAMESLMTKDFLYLSGTGRMDHAAALKAWSEPKCEGNAYAFSDPKVVMFTKDVALATYFADVKGTCDGKPNPPRVWVASFNFKDGDHWKNAFYMDSPR